MSLISYLQSQEISQQQDWDFSAHIMCALRKADSHNYNLLASVFPTIENEFSHRYRAPGGCMSESELEWRREYDAAKREKE